MHFTNEQTEDGVTERQFELTVAGERVPGALFTPAGARGGRPLVLYGHGGGMHRRAPPVVGTGRRYATALGYAVAVIEAPGHGARVDPADAARVGAAERDRILRSGGMRGEALEATVARAAQMVPEWKAALDALQALPEVGTGPVGYAGVSMGAFLGIPLVADEPRITAAVFGLVGAPADHPLVGAARRITVPVELTAQWDDDLVARDDAWTLFGALGSREKSLHLNAGGHLAMPAFERDAWEVFLRRHLGPVG